jgi:uncharacterized protein
LANIPADVASLVDKMLQKRLYVVLSSPLKPLAELKPLLAEHLRYLIELERRGTLFASGPFFDEAGNLLGASLTILRAASLEEARAIASQDPLHIHRLREYEIRGWQLNEGSYTVNVRYSNSSLTIA